MCLLDKSFVDFHGSQIFCGYKVFLVDRNGLLFSPFIKSAKIPFKFVDVIDWKKSDNPNNIGFYSFLNFKDAENFEISHGAGFSVEMGQFLNLEVRLLSVTHFGINDAGESCLISQQIILKNFNNLIKLIKENENNNYFYDNAKKITSMTVHLYNSYVDSFKDYSFYAHN